MLLKNIYRANIFSNGTKAGLIYRDFRDASLRKTFCLFFFFAELTVFLQPEAEIAITSKRLEIET